MRRVVVPAARTTRDKSTFGTFCLIFDSIKHSDHLKTHTLIRRRPKDSFFVVQAIYAAADDEH